MTDLLKNEIILEKKKPKKLYKNWKFYTISLGTIIVVTGTGLGIYYGLEANNPGTISQS
ncbi:MAG: hypothetical protein REH79_00165 [Spiroplasma sp.]|nr:hypothetical protein [Spiroplasma sp.]